MKAVYWEQRSAHVQPCDVTIAVMNAYACRPPTSVLPVPGICWTWGYIDMHKSILLICSRCLCLKLRVLANLCSNHCINDPAKHIAPVTYQASICMLLQ